MTVSRAPLLDVRAEVAILRHGKHARALYAVRLQVVQRLCAQEVVADDDASLEICGEKLGAQAPRLSSQQGNRAGGDARFDSRCVTLALHRFKVEVRVERVSSTAERLAPSRQADGRAPIDSGLGQEGDARMHLLKLARERAAQLWLQLGDRSGVAVVHAAQLGDGALEEASVLLGGLACDGCTRDEGRLSREGGLIFENPGTEKRAPRLRGRPARGDAGAAPHRAAE